MSMTGGRGGYHMEFSCYDEMASHLQTKDHREVERGAVGPAASRRSGPLLGVGVQPGGCIIGQSGKVNSEQLPFRH
jgi:hypothetical protein